MPTINNVELISFQPVGNADVVLIIGKHSARFKVVDLSLLSLEQKTKKLEAYMQRFVKVVENCEQSRQVFISPNAPHLQELMQAAQTLSIDGTSISQINILSETEYEGFSTALVASVKAAQKKLDVDNEASKEISGQSSLAAPYIFYSSKVILQLKDWFTAKFQGCFPQCSKEILATFIETEIKMAELDKEADKAKRAKLKELKKRLLKQDILSQEFKSNLLMFELLRLLVK